jgi:hypothetical protein
MNTNANIAQPNESARCVNCEKTKPLDELNGTGLGPNADHSKAYCRHLASCDSEYARSIIAELMEAIGE